MGRWVRFRESCTNFIYDSDWGYSDRFFTEMPVQAGLPEGFTLVQDSITAFFFDVSWTVQHPESRNGTWITWNRRSNWNFSQAGAPGQCVFEEWVMEVFQISAEPGSWAIPPLIEEMDPPQTWVRHKCVASRESPQCRPGDLPRARQFLEALESSQTCQERCTDPNADGDFVMLGLNAGLSSDRSLNYKLPGTFVMRAHCITSLMLAEIPMLEVTGVQSYSFYNVRMRERCSDGTAESADASLEAEIWPFLADPPENLTISSPEPFTLNLKWVPGDSQECVFSHWDVQLLQGRRFGDLVDRFSRESVAEKWYGEILDLENSSDLLNWRGFNHRNISANLENHHGPRNAALGQVKPVAITIDAWIAVPECSLPDRSATSCTIVGTVVYVGTNPDTNSKTIYFGSQGLNACAYHTKCCQDEFSLCYATDQAGREAAANSQDLFLSCVNDPDGFESNIFEGGRFDGDGIGCWQRTDMFYSAALCTEQPETATSCNVTETFACYKDKTYAGFFDVCIPGVDCPLTDIENVTACEIACSRQAACRALRFQAAYGHCYLIDSSENQLNDDPLHETTGCARNLGLESLSGYELQVSQRCEDPEADSNFVTVLPGLGSNETTIAPATQPEDLTPLGPTDVKEQLAKDVEVQAVKGTTIRLSFTPGVLRDFMPIRTGGALLEMDDSTDCVFHQWRFQVKLNSSEAPSHGPVSCTQYPMVCELRVSRGEHLDGQDLATPADRVENFTVMVEIIDYNISLTFDWDVHSLDANHLYNCNMQTDPVTCSVGNTRFLPWPEAGEDNDCIFTGMGA
eukprot:Skav231143  [mRNA]  locus=scaffold2333:65122:92265:+ [translate_table: standard]